MPGPPPPPIDLSNAPLSAWIPDSFPDVQQLKVQRSADPSHNMMGDFQPGPDEAHLGVLSLHPDTIAQQQEYYNRPDTKNYISYPTADGAAAYQTPRILAHEAGHAIWETLFNGMGGGAQFGGAPKTQMGYDVGDVISEWNGVHAKSVAKAPQVGNNALGKYDQPNPRDQFQRYAQQPSHSFADAFGSYTTDPEWLKSHYPEAYAFFQKHTGFEYSRKPKQ